MLIKEKYYAFSFQPGVVNFDDIYEALESFKSEVDQLKEKALAAQAEADAKAKEAAENSPEEASSN
jgi:outer membrane protein assembly factor BamE (lipoprotein component of BamABCDE complex)